MLPERGGLQATVTVAIRTVTAKYELGEETAGGANRINSLDMVLRFKKLRGPITLSSYSEMPECHMLWFEDSVENFTAVESFSSEIIVVF